LWWLNPIFSITLTPLDPVTLQLLPQVGPAQTVRPGVSLSVAVVQFSAQPPANSNPGQTAGIQPVASGTAIVTLPALPGNPTPNNWWSIHRTGAFKHASFLNV
jgi:hypothetical protein